MRLHSNPIYRKVIIPWYDSDIFCGIALFLLFIIFFFGLAGIWTAHETPDYTKYVWVPRVLTVISAVAALSLAFRLVSRYVDRYRDYD
ncbi:MAG: hypothetical protein KKB94_09920 [Proteobacteria bacterium]|nr:hypothetical protein [Pseudomonadota bacterium]